MENSNQASRSLWPIILIFIVVTFFLELGSGLVAGWGVDYRVPLVGNAVLFFATVVSFILYLKGLHTNNPHAIVRTMYGGVMVRLFVCMIAALIYVLIVRQAANRNGIIGCFALYVVYTVLEVRILLSLSKKNAQS